MKQILVHEAEDVNVDIASISCVHDHVIIIDDLLEVSNNERCFSPQNFHFDALSLSLNCLILWLQILLDPNKNSII